MCYNQACSNYKSYLSRLYYACIYFATFIPAINICNKSINLPGNFTAIIHINYFIIYQSPKKNQKYEDNYTHPGYQDSFYSFYRLLIYYRFPKYYIITKLL